MNFSFEGITLIQSQVLETPNDNYPYIRHTCLGRFMALKCQIKSETFGASVNDRAAAKVSGKICSVRYRLF